MRRLQFAHAEPGHLESPRRSERSTKPHPHGIRHERAADVFFLDGFVALSALEIVLGVDNLVFIAILTGRLPPEKRAMARQLGLAWRRRGGSCCCSPRRGS